MPNGQPAPLYEAIEIGGGIRATIDRLQQAYRDHNQRSRSYLHKLVVSGFVITQKLQGTPSAMEALLERAQLLTRETLTSDQAAFAVMAIMLDANNRSARKTASEYGRAIDTMLSAGATAPDAAFKMLTECGVKRLAQRKSSMADQAENQTTEARDVQYTLLCPSHLASFLVKAGGQLVMGHYEVDQGSSKRPRVRLISLRTWNRHSPPTRPEKRPDQPTEQPEVRRTTEKCGTSPRGTPARPVSVLATLHQAARSVPIRKTTTGPQGSRADPD